MILRKGSLGSAYSGLQCCLCTQSSSAYGTSTSPTTLPIPRARPCPTDRKKRKVGVSQYRSYATVKDSKSYDFRDNMNWPCHKPPTNLKSLPTPYDIFDIHKTETYSKQKFHELVKIYHPDRQSHHSPDNSIHTLPSPERLERYRLIVQAHTILSDPIRRKAYDTTGAGWGTQSSWHTTSGSSRPHTPTDPDSPFANATWEDWERWYSRTSTHSQGKHPHGAGPQTYAGTYVNPNMFASFVIIMAVLSGILQATQAGSYTGSVEERAQAFTAKTTQFMSERKVENTEYSTAGYSGHGQAMFNGTAAEGPGTGVGGGADHRIRHFLERRDPTRWGLKDEEEETYRRHFGKGQLALPPPPSLSGKGVVRQRDGEGASTAESE